MGDYDFLKLYDGVLCMYVCMYVGGYVYVLGFYILFVYGSVLDILRWMFQKIRTVDLDGKTIKLQIVS